MAKKDPEGGQVDYDSLGYTRAEAQSRFDKQAEFCAKGGQTPWNGGDGKWKKDGKVVGDPAGPFNPKDKKGKT